MRTLVPGAALLIVVTACGSGPALDDGGDAAGGTSPARDVLAIDVDLGDGSASLRWTLVCDDVAEGTHPDPGSACARLEGLDDPFAPLPEDVACTEQFGGPQTAHVAGVWGGKPVDVRLSRVDGCRISQWDSMGPVLPIEVGPAG